MTHQELDALLDGAAGATLTLCTPHGPIQVRLDRHELENRVAWRAAMRRQLGHVGYQPPHYSRQDHDQIVRAMFALADAKELAPTR